MRIKKLPDNATEHECEKFKAVTVPADGFEKLIVYYGPKVSWVHKSLKIVQKKKKKRVDKY